MGDTHTDPVIAKLKNLRPHHVQLTLATGEVSKVKIPSNGNKWVRLQDVLGRVQWTQIDAFDGQNSLLGVVRADEFAAPDDDDQEEEEEASDDYEGKMLVLLAKVLTKRDTALAQTIATAVAAGVAAGSARDTAQMAGMNELMRGLTSGIAAISESYREAARVRNTADMVEASQGSPEIMQIVQMAMMAMNQPKQVQAPPPPPKQIAPPTRQHGDAGVPPVNVVRNADNSTTTTVREPGP